MEITEMVVLGVVAVFLIAVAIYMIKQNKKEALKDASDQAAREEAWKTSELNPDSPNFSQAARDLAFPWLKK